METYLLKKESELDNITAISGSGPAYLFEFTCALEEAAKEIGLDAQMAKELALQTIIGSAKLMENSDFSPEELRIQVTSPNGTTQAALESFASDQLRETVKRAARAAKIDLSNYPMHDLSQGITVVTGGQWTDWKCDHLGPQ